MARPIDYFRTRQRITPDWIIPGWLKRRNTGFILGAPKRACKSWLLLNMAWDLSDGLPLWNIIHSKNGPVFAPPRPMRVVYLTQEDTEDDVQDRVELMLAAGRLPNDRIWIVPKDLRLVLDTPEGMTILQDELDGVVDTAGPIDLVLLDPMRRLHQGDENSSELMAKLWGLLDRVHARYNCSTVFSHHIVKPPTAKGNTFDITSPYAARGSSDLYGGGDAFINVSPQNMHGRSNTQSLLHLYFDTKRSRRPTSVELLVDFTTGGTIFQTFI